MAKIYDVFFYEAFKEEQEAIKKYLPKNINAGFSYKTIQETNSENPCSKIISIRTQSVIPEVWSDKISGILTRSTGYDHILRYLKKTNIKIPWGYLPLYCNRAVAEQALLLWLALYRKLFLQKNNFNLFHRDGLTGFESKNKNLLVVGVGNIGYEICKIGKGLEMNVFGVDIIKKHNDINYIDISEGLKIADIIVCSMNLTNDNIGYFNYLRLKKAKKGVIFINVSRGEMSPSKDLLQLIKENHLGGLALDVYNKEPKLADALRNKISTENEEVLAAIELSKYSNVITTPHNAFNTFEAVERKAKHSIEQIEYFLKNKRFLWAKKIK
ncbi:MAG: hypothetical protein J7J86_02150 [Bacteroidales bacterium]|nr:hypothetical protein [Bacteroidales bacterium]